MDRVYPPEAWQRLGRALELRRWQLGYGHRQRGRFAQAHGSAVSDKTLARIERGDRDAYPDATIAHIEDLYGLAPGSIEAFLGGGEFTVIDDPGTVSGLSPDEKRTVLAFVELLRRGQPAAGEGQRPA